MKRTAEQMGYDAKLRALLHVAGMASVRVGLDAEGWPIVPGRLGQVEWIGHCSAHAERLYVFTARKGIIARLLKIPRVHRWQMGDGEARMWFAAHDIGCLREVLRVIRARVRRPRSEAQKAAQIEALRKAHATRRPA